MIPNIYEWGYKKLIIFPLFLLLLAFCFIPQIKFGVDFAGGTLIILDLNQPVNGEELKNNLAKEGIIGSVQTYFTSFGPKAEIEIPQSQNIQQAEKLLSSFSAKLDEVSFLEVQSNANQSVFEKYLEERKNLNNISNAIFALANKSVKAENIENLNVLKSEVLSAHRIIYDNYKKFISKSLEKYANYSSFSVQTVSPALSMHFIDNAIKIALFAAILSTIFIFIFFRSLVPSAAVIIGALCDVIIAMGAMGFFGIPLTLASFAALLMLLGFSLDTDILLTMRMLKRAGEPKTKAFEAMKTGITMSITAIFAFLILYLVGMYTHISIYLEISAVALAGLFGDIFATWGINAVILLYYVEGKMKETKTI